MTAAVPSKVSQADNHKHNDNVQLLGCGPGIQTLGATSFDDLLNTIEVIIAFARQTGVCIGLLGATLEGITVDSPGEIRFPRAGQEEQRAAAILAAEVPLRGEV
jgi:hypothetical protein